MTTTEASRAALAAPTMLERDDSSNSAPPRPARWTVLTSRFTHCVHAYHGVDAFSRDGARLLYAGIVQPGVAALVVRDLDTHRETVLAEKLPCNFHTAARQRWVLHDSAVLTSMDGSDGLPCPMLAQVDRPGEVELLRMFAGCSVRHICPDQIHAGASRGFGSHAAVLLLNLQERTEQTLVSAARCVAVLPPGLRCDVEQAHFNHPVPNDDCTRIFFKLMEGGGVQQRFVAFFTYHRPTDELICLDNRISGHPFWMPDGQHILNVQSPRDGSDNRYLVTQHWRTGTVTRVLDSVIEGPGHPAVSPDGRWISTDAFAADGQQAWVYLVEPQQRRATRITHLPHHFGGGPDQQHPLRGQPHPVWFPDSQRLLVNCNFHGRGYRLVMLDDFLPG